MNILVVGCGKIGLAITESLVSEGHNVVVVDQSASVITDISNTYDVMGVCGNGADSDVLVEAGAEHADLCVAVTDSDEVNMLVCCFARKMGAGHTIARIRKPEYNDSSLSFFRETLELSMSINPELLTAQELFNMLKLPSAMKIETFSGQSFEMIELVLKEDSPLVGQKLSDLRGRYKAKFLVCVVQRGSLVTIPDGNFVLESGDRIGLTAAPAEVEKLLRSMGLVQKQARDVMILGASRTAYYLASLLSGIGGTVKILERDRSRCQELCELLPNATLIHADGAQRDILLEEGLPNMDAFVALTGMDEENILISIFAASQKVPKVISKVNRDELSQLAKNVGLESIVSPRKIIADVLVQYARACENSMGSSVETLYHLMDGKAEALEFIVREDFRQVRIPLKDLKTKSNTLIAGITRGRSTIIPSGSDVILPGDKVVVISASHRLRVLSDILA